MVVKNKNPWVSIIITAYNAEGYIKRALESALNQTYKNIEIIVVDDGSTDKTADIIRSYEDHRIVYVYQENQWLGAARNTGIRKSNGHYISFMDADDFYLPQKVGNQVKFLEQHSEYDIVYCNALHFYTGTIHKLFKKKYKCPSGDIFRNLLLSSVMNPNTPMFRSSIFKDGIMFYSGKEKFPEDWDIFLRISREGHKFGFLDEDLVMVEMREGSLTRTWDEQWIYRKNTVMMLENFFSQMSKQEKNLFKTNEIIKKHKIKLSIAYLIAEQKKMFYESISNLYPKYIVYLILGAISFIPTIFLKKVILRLWRIKQKYSFNLVKTYKTT